MRRPLLVAALLIAGASAGMPSVNVYPALTRETLVGVWEGLFNFDTTYTILHIAIAPENDRSYLVEITAGQGFAGIFRLEKCAVADGKVQLEFRASDGREWWMDGEGGG